MVQWMSESSCEYLELSVFYILAILIGHRLAYMIEYIIAIIILNKVSSLGSIKNKKNESVHFSSALLLFLQIQVSDISFFFTLNN